MPQNTVIVCGLGRVGRYVLEYLRAAGLKVVGIDNAWPEHEPLPDGVRLIRGDCRQRHVLEEAGVTQARGVMVLTNDDLTNVSTALTVRGLHPDVRIVLRMFNQNLVTRLGQAVRNVYALSTSALTAPLLATIATSGEALGAFDVTDGRRQITELALRHGSMWIGKTITDVTQQTFTHAIAYVPHQGPERLLTDVDDKALLQPGDKLILCGEPRVFNDLLLTEDESALVWASRARRLARVFFTSYNGLDRATRIAFSIFALTVLTSVLVYHYSIGKGWAEALFRTVSVMGTATDMHREELIAEWQLVFASALRIVGAALIATFTAIVVNVLLRIRLEGALEAARIPERGHVVVCGLSNVGFRIIEELQRMRISVVALEQSRDNRFLSTVRRQRVPVLLGDATVPQTLKLARASTARAVVASTSDELANLEIALLTREANPKQRVVVLLNEPRLANALREASNIKYALSPAMLSAPAFVAALFSDKFQTLFLVNGKPLCAVAFTVLDDDPLLNGHTVRELMVDFRMLPIALTRADGMAQRDLPAHRLDTGDRLHAIMALPDLDRLLRRQAPPAIHSIDVTAFPLTARPGLIQLLRIRRGFTVDEADAALTQLPVCLAELLTRGQAEDLLSHLQREKVHASMRMGAG